MVTVAPDKVDRWRTFLRDNFKSSTNTLPAMKLGEVKSNATLLITQNKQKLIELSISKLIDQFENAIPNRIYEKH